MLHLFSDKIRLISEPWSLYAQCFVDASCRKKIWTKLSVSVCDLLFCACRNFCVRRDFVSNPDALKKRLVFWGLAMFLLSPFLVIFMLVYLFLRHAEQFYNHPTTASSRRWSNLSKWMFREFNEASLFSTSLLLFVCLITWSPFIHRSSNVSPAYGPSWPGRNEIINILMMLCDFLSLLNYMYISFAWSPPCAPNFYGFCSFLGLISIVLDKLRLWTCYLINYYEWAYWCGELHW